MVGVRRGTAGRVRTGPIEGLAGQRSDGERKGGEERAWQRARTERTSLGPEDRPSKLSHALSVLRKRRIGVVVVMMVVVVMVVLLLRCSQERGAEREGRVGERG